LTGTELTLHRANKRANGIRQPKAARDINREKGEQQKGNKHAKNSEHQYIIPSDKRPQAAPHEFLP
jgi:hypothetical protein